MAHNPCGMYIICLIKVKHQLRMGHNQRNSCAICLLHPTGFNPFFKNKEKTAEPWILHDFQEPFYGQVCATVKWFTSSRWLVLPWLRMWFSRLHCVFRYSQILHVHRILCKLLPDTAAGCDLCPSALVCSLCTYVQHITLLLC